MDPPLQYSAPALPALAIVAIDLVQGERFYHIGRDLLVWIVHLELEDLYYWLHHQQEVNIHMLEMFQKSRWPTEKG